MVAGVAALVVVALVRLPSDTGTPTLALRATVALGIGIGLIVLVARVLRALAEPPPPPPPEVDAREADVVYSCTVCGTRVRLEVAVTGKPPRHCGEEMEPTVAS